MKRNSVTFVVGALLLVLFVLLLFTFQVRQTEVAVVTTFDKPSRPIENPGLHFKWPWPIQNVYTFDKRVQTIEDKYEETPTMDGYNLLAMVYVGWTISDPTKFFNSFPSGRVSEAEPVLERVIRSEKNAVIGQHPFTDFVSTNQEDLKIATVEARILEGIQAPALEKYGVDIRFVGIKRLGLPESVTTKVFDRMRAERRREVESLRAQGEGEALKLRAAADRDRDEILARANARASELRGKAESEASEHLAVFQQEPRLAEFLLKLTSLEQTLKERSTLILDENTPPFDLLKNQHPAGRSVLAERPMNLVPVEAPKTAAQPQP